MSRVEILEQIRRFGLQAEGAPDSRIVIEGQKGAFTEAEAMDWIDKRAETYCPSCGKPWEE